MKANNDYTGLCDSVSASIKITSNQDAFGERDSVLHETMHAILRQQGREYKPAEEVYVTALATGLLGVLRSNPAFAQYLLEN